MHFSCEDLIKAGFKNDCCSSCHSDEEEGFTGLSELCSEDAGIVGAKRTGNLSDYDGDDQHIVYCCCAEHTFDETNPEHWQRLIKTREEKE